MSTKVIPCDMSITRSNHDKVNIEIQCGTSLAHFVNVELTLEQFAFLITGRHQSDLKMQVNNLDCVGKQRIREDRQVLCPHKSYYRDKLTEWLKENCQGDGYILNTYLGSQTSVKHVDNGVLLNYSVMKFVDVE